MTKEQIIKMLLEYNKWRKGKIEIMPYTPKEISEAIQTAITFLKKAK